MLARHLVVMIATHAALLGKNDGAMLFGLFDEDVGNGAAGIFKIDVLVFEFHMAGIIAYAG